MGKALIDKLKKLIRAYTLRRTIMGIWCSLFGHNWRQVIKISSNDRKSFGKMNMCKRCGKLDFDVCIDVADPNTFTVAHNTEDTQPVYEMQYNDTHNMSTTVDTPPTPKTTKNRKRTPPTKCVCEAHKDTDTLEKASSSPLTGGV